MQVIKRNKQRVEFQKRKIINAILKAFMEVDSEKTQYAKEKAKEIANYIEKIDKELSVEEIQDIVEEKLMASNRKDVARAYVRYRYKKELAREARTNLDNEILGIKDGTSEEVINNANKNGKLLQTLKPMIADVTIIDQAKRFFIPKKILDHHQKEIYIHDMNYFGIPMVNCMLVNWEDCLENGMVIGNAPVEKPNSITVAVNLLSQIAAHVSSNCYGGITFINLVKGLCQYGEGSLKTWRKIAKENNVPDEESFSWKMLKREIHKSIKGLEYEILTLTNSRGEIPFTTFEIDCIDLNASEEKQKIQYLILTEFLKTRIEGLTGGITPVFPKLCFQLKKGNNLNPEDKYYDTFKLAIKCSSLRLYPDYLMTDKIIEVTGGYKAPMSCVDGEEIICYKFKNQVFCESFKRMWNRLSDYYEVKVQQNGKDLYIDTNEVEIYDTKKGFVKNYRIIKNNTENWLRLAFSNGRTLTCTLNHPFETENRGVVYAKDLTNNDIIKIGKSPIAIDNSITFDVDKAWLLGLMLCDGCYDKHISVTMNCKDEYDIIKRCKNVLENKYFVNTKLVDRSNDTKRHYIEVEGIAGRNSLIDLMNYFIKKFGGIKKLDRQIPNEVFSWNKEAQLSFMAGMIDADGYLNDTKTLKIQLGSINKELALQQAMLARQLGMESSIYLNRYSKVKPNAVRYRVEFVPTEELVSHIVCEKKRKHFNEWTRKNNSISNTDICNVTKVEKITQHGYSYDVTTSSEHFEVSGIYSHNCRSFIPELSDESGNRIVGGGFNCGVCSINLPRLAILANHSEEKFFELLKKYLDLTKEALWIRRNTLKNVKAKQAPILFMYGAIARLQPEETIEKLLYKNRSTISFGYVGLHNALIALYGKSYDTDPNMIDKGEKILQFMRDYCDNVKKETGIGASLYSTPAETLATKFCREDVKDFGVIEGVNDKGYYENSFHYPSNEDVIAFNKIDIEGQMSYIPSGGAIQYTEFGNMVHNTQALERVVRYAYDKCHYFGVDVSSDRCYKCGYVGEMETLNPNINHFKCPQCGNEDNTQMSVIRRLCGYLGSLSERPTIDGKMREISNRVKHDKKIGG